MNLSTEQKIEICARAAHAANHAYCEAISDRSQLPWDQAANWQRQSAIRGVSGVLNGNTPEQQHEAWMADKIADGWKWGSVKDPEKKEHPCIVPYAELPPEQQLKDAIFVNTVKGIASAVGLV